MIPVRTVPNGALIEYQGTRYKVSMDTARFADFQNPQQPTGKIFLCSDLGFPPLEIPEDTLVELIPLDAD